MVSPMQVIRDSRVLSNTESWVPWNLALAVLGVLGQAAAWWRLGDD